MQKTLIVIKLFLYGLSLRDFRRDFQSKTLLVVKKSSFSVGSPTRLLQAQQPADHSVLIDARDDEIAASLLLARLAPKQSQSQIRC
jgi:hypothetical protein